MSSAANRVQLAQLQLDAAHSSLVQSAAPLRASLRRNPATWMIGGGFAFGLVAGLLPVHRWLQTGFYLASTGVRLMTPFLAGIEAASTETSAAPNVE